MEFVMGKENSVIPMGESTMATGNTGPCMVTENCIILQENLLMKVNGLTINFQVKELFTMNIPYITTSQLMTKTSKILNNNGSNTKSHSVMILRKVKEQSSYLMDPSM